VCTCTLRCRWKSGRELESWRRYNREIQEAKSEEELSCQKPETTADISRSEIQVPYQVSSMYIDILLLLLFYYYYYYYYYCYFIII